jgi:uncharacterized membrane protein (UPF0182 family)
MDPYYLLMRLPDEEQEEFLILRPFVPFSVDDSRKDLTAFMVAKSDPDNYGELEVFEMPRQQQIDGPALVNARINQEPDISREITLLGSPGRGSKVTLGSMLLIPVNQSLLYIQPLYVESEATPLPQLKRVIVVYADKVVMKPSLQEALTTIFGSAPTTLEQTPVGTPTPPGPTAPPADGAPPSPDGAAVPPGAQSLLAEADARFRAAEDALRGGDLARYQSEVNAARDLIRRANESLAGGATTTTPTVPPPPPPPS